MFVFPQRETWLWWLLIWFLAVSLRSVLIQHSRNFYTREAFYTKIVFSANMVTFQQTHNIATTLYEWWFKLMTLNQCLLFYCLRWIVTLSGNLPSPSDWGQERICFPSRMCPILEWLKLLLKVVPVFLNGGRPLEIHSYTVNVVCLLGFVCLLGCLSWVQAPNFACGVTLWLIQVKL